MTNVPESSCGGCQIELIFENVPDNALVAADWTMKVFATDQVVGSVRLDVIKGTTTQLVVSVRAGDGRGQVARTMKDNALIAAARAFPRREAKDPPTASHGVPRVTNAAQLSLTPRVAVPAGASWRLVDSTWGSRAEFFCTSSHSFEPLSPGRECEVRPDRIDFAVERPFKTELVVTAELLVPDSSRSDTSTLNTISADLSTQDVDSPDKVKPRMRVVARAFWTLATQARNASLPIPLWPAVRVTCRTDRLWRRGLYNWAFNGDSLAIDDHGVENNECSITFDYAFEHLATVSSPEAPGQASGMAGVDGGDLGGAAAAWRNTVDLGGPQGVSLTVSHGSDTVTIPFVVLPDQGLRLPLPTPEKVSGAGAANTSDPYIVTVKLQDTDDAIYLEESLPAASAASPENSVSMTLRPRGQFSTTWPLRLSVTFPVSAVTVRFPPLARDVTSSDQSTRAGFAPIRASAVLVLEYWDYAHDQNKLGVPVQLQGGLSVFKLTDTPLDLNLLLGGAVSLAVVGEGFKETSISVGMFWEHGLQEPHNAMILTFGFDLFKPAKTAGATGIAQ